ncbi:MAG: YkgJ family cysteine cluster protein [Desulfobacterales bacterium]|nr:MAG: YkgJ family cysteine cluster protein [Desulfobacterales bacterium]
MHPDRIRKPIPSKLSAGTQKRKPITACIRCGTCCQKGGPSFHHADKNLIEKGIIHSRHLYTIRRGQLAYDNVRDCLMPVDSDIIKIKGKKDSWACIFFEEDEKACRIYANRPLECRVLKCWDTREIEKIYAENRLTRKDLISEVKGLWDLIKDHQGRCDHEKIHKWVKALDSAIKKEARKELIELIQYDTEIRKLVVSKAGLDAEMLDFLFGRPLIETIENYGLNVEQSGKKISLMSTSRRKK